MNLLRRGPHTVSVTPMVLGRDKLGRTLVPGDPVVVRNVAVQSSTSHDANMAEGERGEYRIRIIGAGVWPGGDHSRIEVVEGPPGTIGMVFDQRGPAKQRAMSPRTAHFSVAAAARSREVR